jgi:superfamily I DNA/RNA helicase
MAQLETTSTGKGLSFNTIIPEAIDLLKGASTPIGMEADAFRTRLVGNLSHILVDEYQDIESDAYEFVGLLAGKAQTGAENRLQILAVGDDDQSIYQFAGANVEFIRRFGTTIEIGVIRSSSKTSMFTTWSTTIARQSISSQRPML